MTIMNARDFEEIKSSFIKSHEIEYWLKNDLIEFYGLHSTG